MDGDLLLGHPSLTKAIVSSFCAPFFLGIFLCATPWSSERRPAFPAGATVDREENP